MAKLIRCKCCGGEVASNCKVCVHCGAKMPKSAKGCAILLLIVFVVALIAAISPQKEKSPERPKKPEPISFDDTRARVRAQMFIEELINTRTELKFPHPINVYKYTPHGDAKKFFETVKMDMRNFYSVDGIFTEKNAFGVDIKFKYEAIIYWNSKTDDYKCVQLFIDGVEVFPKYSELNK